MIKLIPLIIERDNKKHKKNIAALSVLTCEKNKTNEGICMYIDAISIVLFEKKSSKLN